MAFPSPIRITEKDFGEDEYKALTEYIGQKVKYIKAKTRGIRETLLPKWIRIYKGIPAEETKTFPWPGASNLVIELAATYSDELLSRVMAIYANDPLFVAKILGDFGDGAGEDQREMLEQFLSDMALEPDELDLYRVEETWFSSTIRYGTGIVKFPYEYVVEQKGVYLGGGGTDEASKVSFKFDEVVRRDGPHPETVPLNRFGVDPKCANLGNADFFYHTLNYDAHKMEELLEKTSAFEPIAVEYVIAQGPDRVGPDEVRLQQESTKMSQTEPNKCSEEWDIEECWLQYRKDGQIFRLIAYYHLRSETLLGVIYNPYPDNLDAFEDAKLAYDDDTYYGYGFCEMLESYQREATITHNWRVDNRHFATTGIGRVNKNSKLSSLLQIYPGVLIPADEGEVDFFPVNQGAGLMSTEDEMLTLQLATQRAGVDPAVGGLGAGTVNSKKGNFSTQGMTIMQQQNNRNNLRMSDMRSAHVRLGRKLLRIYSEFGLGTKIRRYRDRAEILTKALDNYKSKKLGLVIKPASASMNREVEKQNDILLSATLERLYAGDAQILQSLSMQGMPEEMKNYYVQVLKAKNSLMKHILRNFGHEDSSRLIPVPSFLKEQRDGAAAGQNSSAGGSVGAVSQASQLQGQNQGAIPVGGGAAFGAVPPPSAELGGE